MEVTLFAVKILFALTKKCHDDCLFLMLSLITNMRD